MDRGAWWAQSMGSQRVGHNWARMCFPSQKHPHLANEWSSLLERTTVLVLSIQMFADESLSYWGSVHGDKAIDTSPLSAVLISEKTLWTLKCSANACCFCVSPSVSPADGWAVGWSLSSREGHPPLQSSCLERALGIQGRCPVAPGVVPCRKQTPVLLTSGHSQSGLPPSSHRTWRRCSRVSWVETLRRQPWPFWIAPRSMLPGSCRRPWRAWAQTRQCSSRSCALEPIRWVPAEPPGSVHVPVREGYSSQKGKCS